MEPKTIFCTREQTETEHSMTLDQNGEIVARCACGHFIKLPNVTGKELTDLIDLHAESNQGQQLVEEDQAEADDSEPQE